MCLLVQVRRQFLVCFAAMLLSVIGGGGAAFGAGWGSCALGANCGFVQCVTDDEGYPYYNGDEPACIHEPDAPPCYFCTYSQESPERYGYCTQSPFPFTEEYTPACSDCRMHSWPGALPPCPAD